MICEIFGCIFNFIEIVVYFVMWLEYCFYKNLIYWFKQLLKDGLYMLVKVGEENVGFVDLGDGIGCVFKIELYNYFFVFEFYQGVVIGVGGINCDIFIMGVWLVVQFNLFCFGLFDCDCIKWLVKGVVKGIGDYGNVFGILIVGGEVFFDKLYNQNLLVNVFLVGIIDMKKVILVKVKGLGNLVYIVGLVIGKDGIVGVVFVFKDIMEELVNDLFFVQVGDFFMEKLFFEVIMELL